MATNDSSNQWQCSLERIGEGTHTEADLSFLREALRTGQIAVAEGDGSVAISGNVGGAVIVTGSNNFFVLPETTAAIIRQLARAEDETVASAAVEIELASLGEDFSAQLNIAAHFKDEHDTQHAIYLADNLYVHRSATEQLLLDEAQRFSVQEQAHGKWISIVGNAGRGKSSLLWSLFQQLKEIAQQWEPRLSIIPFQAQMLGQTASEEIKATVQRVLKTIPPGQRVIVLIDTLDILVGINDPGLSQTINTLRSSGCLLITASRRQEAEQLYTLVNRDRHIELPHYSDEEFSLITQRYIEKAYPGWVVAQKEQQFNKVANLLEQRRNANELDFEPLILRMIFEVYAPHDIPQDINTQKVYQRFWEERVLRDRGQSLAQQLARDRMCRLFARFIVFDEERGHTDVLSVDRFQAAWRQEFTTEFPVDTLHSLVSSGVLQWAIGRSAVRFFHQTFLEYTAAYDTRCGESLAEKERRIELLLKDVGANELFRVPVLKQLAIQDYHEEQQEWRPILRHLRLAGNLLAAQLLFEIIGKIDEEEFCRELCEEWIQDDDRIIGAVIVEAVRHYPRKRIPLALQLLKPFLQDDRQFAIYTLCQKSFAVLAAAEVHDFLRSHLESARRGDRNVRTFYKDALCAALLHGAIQAGETLADLFPRLDAGQQAGMLENMEAMLTEANAAQFAEFLCERIYPTLSSSMAWKAFAQFFSKIHESSPQMAAAQLRVLISAKEWQKEKWSAQFIGSLIGVALADEVVVRTALQDLYAKDHLQRLTAAAILNRAPDQYTDLIVQQLLASETTHKDILPSLFLVIAGRKNAAPETLIQFLERWENVVGTGEPIREILRNLANQAPERSKQWLLDKLPAGKRSHFVFFSLLVQTNAGLFNAEELSQVYRLAKATGQWHLREFASVAGCLAVVDEQRASQFFADLLRHGDDACRQAAISSLRFCLASHPALVLQQSELVFALTVKSGRLAYLQQLFSIIRDFPQSHGNELLVCLDRWSQTAFFTGIGDEMLLTELIATIKVAAGQNPRLALAISARLPDKLNGVGQGQAAFYMNLCHKSDDDEILLEVLQRFGSLLQTEGLRGNHIRNALGNSLPLLDRKLGGRKVIEMIFGVCQRVGDERSLEDLMRAAVRVPSLTEADISALLNLDLPEKARGILLRKRKAQSQ